MGLGILLRLLASLQILPRLVSPAAPLPAPTVIADPQHPVYFPGEHLTLRCSAPLRETVSIYLFYNQREELVFRVTSNPAQVVMITEKEKAGTYSCEYMGLRQGQPMYSSRSRPVQVPVMDLPSQPGLSMDPPAGVVNEGLSLNITCTAPGDAGEQRFHFYKDGSEIVPGHSGSKISSTDSGITSVLTILKAGPNNTGEYTCRYRKNVSGRWVLSLGSRAVNVTVSGINTAGSYLWVWDLAVGGSFFLINGLIFLATHWCF